ncbi:ribonuclease P protein component [bacterium]|nr:ribonuclease P protein component [bacterium]
MYFSLNSGTIQKIKRFGKTYRSETVSVKFLSENQYRYSPVISKKQGNAVQRNRIKRIIRDIMTSGRINYPKGMYIIYLNAPCSDAKRDILLHEINVLIENIKTRNLTIPQK